jgi:FkbH-like protein
MAAMKLIEALEILRRPVTEGPGLKIFLACGFTPLHLQTFLGAQLVMSAQGKGPEIRTGLFGDLAGSIERLDPSGIDVLAAVIEWGDLDPRLAVRILGGWRPSQVASILESANQSVSRLRHAITGISHRIPAVVCMPTLPLPPMFSTRRTEEHSVEAQLHLAVASLVASLSQQPSVRIVNGQFLNEASPLATRYDLKPDLLRGFPYTLQHACAVAEVLTGLIHPHTPKKGLITDLDDTLWAGILGEDGLDGISWHLERHTQMHGIYQQFLGSLAGAGVLLGVASKNDPVVMERAFERTDLLLSKSDIFPFEIHWSPKSESVARILKTWNLSADSVVFVDDSPMEVAEVQAAFPTMECLVFPKDDDPGIWEQLKRLRDLFGKRVLTEEDSLRLASIRQAGAWRDLGQSSPATADDFLEGADAHITFDFIQPDGDSRAFELVNKTNQFNLNGKRLNESEWRTLLSDPESFLLTASYKDKYGALGKIAVLAGRAQAGRIHLNRWVMSCRAFSRRIEYRCLQYLFDTLAADEIVFAYEASSRNSVFQEFLTEVLAGQPLPGAILTKDQFAARTPKLFHHVEGTVRV